MELDIYQVDAFTDSVFGGNLCCEQNGDRVILTGQSKLYMQGKVYA